MTRFGTGLVVGKFAPLHLGHELLIERARAECERLVVLSYSKPELPGCDPERRAHWLRARFPDVQSLVLDDAWLASHHPELGLRIPHNDGSSTEHGELITRVLIEVLGTGVDAVFSSEDYGEGLAAYLTTAFRARDPKASAVVHVLVDRERRQVPISGTEIRRDPSGQAAWLSPVVRASFVPRSR